MLEIKCGQSEYIAEHLTSLADFNLVTPASRLLGLFRIRRALLFPLQFSGGGEPIAGDKPT